MDEKEIKKYSPMSETMFLILVSLYDSKHGYGVMKFVKERTKGRIVLGAGTIYQTLSKLERAKLIIHTENIDRQKKYIITDKGKEILDYEIKRLKNFVMIAEDIYNEK